MNLWKDVHHRARMLLNSPAFPIAAVVTLALGFGATTAAFSAADAVVEAVPPPNLNSLARIGERTDNPGGFDCAMPGPAAFCNNFAIPNVMALISRSS